MDIIRVVPVSPTSWLVIGGVKSKPEVKPIVIAIRSMRKVKIRIGRGMKKKIKAEPP